MSRQIPLSRAAQLIGIKRRELQKRIKAGDIPSFDGTVEVADLLRVYPEVKLHDNTQLERMERIMEKAVSKQGNEDRKLPDAHVLAARLNGLAQEMVEVKTQNQWYKKLYAELQERLAANSQTSASDIHSWLQARNETSPQLNAPLQHLLAQELSLRTMASNVKVYGTDHEFTVEGSDTILESGLAAGLTLEFGCNDGTCGLCRAKMLEGEVTCSKQHEYALSEAEKTQGYFLMCSYTPVSDAVIEAKIAGGPGDIPQQRIHTKVKKVSDLSDDVTLLALRMPRTRRMRFLAGQFATLIYAGESAIDLPIASCPCNESQLEFHLSKMGDEGVQKFLASGIKFGDEIVVEGPKGDFVLDEASARPQIFIACDAGFAPLKSLMENAMQLEHDQDIYCYWIVNQLQTHYLENLCRSWQDAFDGFHATCLENPVKDINSDNYKNQTESLINSILQQHPGIDEYDIYISGDSVFSSIAASLFANVGFPKKQLHLDMRR